jgi:SAM-dependent methyltransferase
VPVAETGFDELVAARYETYWPELLKPAAIDPVVSFLANMAGDGGALELGVGTGRLALRLSNRGVRVHGIELSPAMAARLRAQPGGAQIGITIGDFATTRVDASTPSHLAFEQYDLAAQIAVSQHYWVIDGQLETFSSAHRYLWPSELDLMAKIAGMTLRERWNDWHRAPFTSESTMHVSVWEKGREPGPIA